MNITVYLGASKGNDNTLANAVRELGTWIGESGNSLVYGGSKSGLMGEIAESVLRAGGLHQSAVEHALEGTPLGDHRVGHGLHDLLQRIAFILRRHERQGRIGAHTARIGTLVAVVGALMVLRQRHRPHLMSRNEAHERKLGTFEVILDDHLALAELVVEQHMIFHYY